MSQPLTLADVQQGLAIVTFWLLFLLAMDTGFRVILKLTDSGGTKQAPEIEDYRIESAPYRDASYDVAAFYSELRSARVEAYTPYVVWRSRPFDGDYIDIDAEGNRSTYHNSRASDAAKIWLFGGSVTWGLGAPDRETISSHLAQYLNDELQIDAVVRNLGEIGFVNTQEIVLLLRELQLGRRPDIVVFLDGVNDAPAAVLWPEFDGNHMNFSSIRDRFEGREKQAPSPVLSLLRRSGTWRMADALRKNLGVTSTRQEIPPYTIPDDPAEAARRGERAGEVWLANRRFVDALGAHYGFTPFYLLQPSLKVGSKQRDSSEVAVLAEEMENDAKRVGMQSFAAMQTFVRRHLDALDRRDPRTVDLTDLFSEVSEPLYFDYVHVAHDGNRLLAKGIANSLRDYACSAREKPSYSPIPARFEHSCE